MPRPVYRAADRLISASPTTFASLSSPRSPEGNGSFYARIGIPPSGISLMNHCGQKKICDGFGSSSNPSLLSPHFQLRRLPAAVLLSGRSSFSQSALFAPRCLGRRVTILQSMYRDNLNDASSSFRALIPLRLGARTRLTFER